MNSIEDLLRQYNIVPKDKELYYQAFTHSTFANEKRTIKSYQRLEFLGDAVLSKLSALKAYETHRRVAEGELTMIRSNSVNGKTLAKFALALHFDKLIRFGNNNDNLNKNEKILEDVFEAFVGAIFLDQGEAKVEEFLQDNVYKTIIEAKKDSLKDPKTQLQEFLQAESREIIQYETFQQGDDFVAEVFHDGNSFGKGRGKTKKEAETAAALNALKLMGKAK